MSPIGVVGALGVFGAGGARVVFGGLGEPGEAIVCAARGEGKTPSSPPFRFRSHFPDASEEGRRGRLGNFVGHCWGSNRVR